MLSTYLSTASRILYRPYKAPNYLLTSHDNTKKVEQAVTDLKSKEFSRNVDDLHPHKRVCRTSSHGGVAQLVEQGTHKPCVTGSIPVAATFSHKNEPVHTNWLFCCVVKKFSLTDCNLLLLNLPRPIFIDQFDSS